MEKMTLEQVLNELRIYEMKSFFISLGDEGDEIPCTLVQNFDARTMKIGKNVIAYCKTSVGDYDFVKVDYLLDRYVKKASYGPLGKGGDYRWTFILGN